MQDPAGFQNLRGLCESVSIRLSASYPLKTCSSPSETNEDGRVKEHGGIITERGCQRIAFGETDNRIEADSLHPFLSAYPLSIR